MTALLIDSIKRDYPNVLSGEQVRNILHIGKRKCTWMLNNGFIKCQNNGKKSRKYSIHIDDLVEYIVESEQHPENYAIPCDVFPNVKLNRKKAGFPHLLPSGFKKWLEKEFKNYPDTFTPTDLIDVTGYSDNTIDRWLSRGWLKCVKTQKGRLIPKEWLINFYCSYGYTIAKMSDKHIELMNRYFYRS